MPENRRVGVGDGAHDTFGLRLTLHEHLAHDNLVAWGWQPGEGRDPAPGSQALLGELIQAWIDTGAYCP
jgi:hypothetical protein